MHNAAHALAIDEHRKPFEPAIWEYKPKPWQKIEQVWFCGAYSDVGGGCERTAKASGDGFEPQLDDLSLDWMIGNARACGLAFDDEVMSLNPLELDPLAKVHDSHTGLYNLVPNTTA